MRNVHIVTVGFDPYPSLEMLASGDVDFIYLLNDRTEKEAIESEKAIRKILDDIKIIPYKFEDIDCYDYQNVYDKIMEIVDKEKERNSDCLFHINFSRGTAIAVGAACTAACTIKDADLYYSKWKKGDNVEVSRRIIHVDVSDLSVFFQLKGATKNVFGYFQKAEDGIILNSELIDYTGLEKNSLSYHTRKLVEMKLIERDIRGKKTAWTATETGKKVLKRIN